FLGPGPIHRLALLVDRSDAVHQYRDTQPLDLSALADALAPDRAELVVDRLFNALGFGARLALRAVVHLLRRQILLRRHGRLETPVGRGLDLRQGSKRPFDLTVRIERLLGDNLAVRI